MGNNLSSAGADAGHDEHLRSDHTNSSTLQGSDSTSTNFTVRAVPDQRHHERQGGEAPGCDPAYNSQVIEAIAAIARATAGSNRQADPLSKVLLFDHPASGKTAMARAIADWAEGRRAPREELMLVRSAKGTYESVNGHRIILTPDEYYVTEFGQPLFSLSDGNKSARFQFGPHADLTFLWPGWWGKRSC